MARNRNCDTSFQWSGVADAGGPPAEDDMRKYFRVTPPSVHQMVLNLHQARLIERVPGKARSIRILVDPEQLAELK